MADGVFVALGAGLDCFAVVAAVWLLVALAGAIAEGLGAEGGVLGRDDHGESVVESEYDQGQEDGGHEHGVGRCLTLADPEQGDPEEADADGGHSDNGRGEEQHRQEEEKDVVDREDATRDRQDVVDRVKDLGVSEQEAAVRAADGVLDLVDASDQHAGEDEERDKEEEQAAEELQWTEHSLKLDPGADDEVVALSAVLCGESFAADQGALLTNQSL